MVDQDGGRGHPSLQPIGMPMQKVNKAEVDKIMHFLSQRNLTNLNRSEDDITFNSILPQRQISGRLTSYFDSFPIKNRLVANGSTFNLSVDYTSEKRVIKKNKKDPTTF